MRLPIVLLAALQWGLLAAAAFAAAGDERPDPSIFIPADRVEAAFTRGEPLLEVAPYKVHASRREAPGRAEVHTRDTDIIYVLSGTATLVTGGSVVDGQPTAPEEIRGAAITGGTAHRLTPGEVVVVPAGTPHWFEEVAAPFLYYVVKVTQPEEGAK